MKKQLQGITILLLSILLMGTQTELKVLRRTFREEESYYDILR